MREHRTATTWEIRSSTGIVGAIIGLTLMTGAVALFVHGFSMPEPDGDDLQGALIFGTTSLLGGLFAMGTRYGKRIDGARREYEWWWGLFFPMMRRRKDLSLYSKLCIRKETRSRKEHTYSVFVVRLNTSAGETGPGIYENSDFLPVRQRAEAIAKILKADIFDESEGAEIIRKHQELDLSLRDKRKPGPPRPPAPQPADSRIRYSQHASDAVFQLPAPGIRLVPEGIFIGMSVAIFVGIVAVSLTMFSSHSKDPLFLPVAGLFVMSGLVTVAIVIRQLRMEAATAVTLRVSPRQLRMESDNPRSRKQEELPADRVEEVLERDGKLWIVSDDKVLTCGAGLSMADREWLRERLIQILSGG